MVNPESGWPELLWQQARHITPDSQLAATALLAMSYHIRNVPGLSTIEMSLVTMRERRQEFSYSASLVSKDDCRQESDEACLPRPQVSGIGLQEKGQRWSAPLG